MKHSLSESTIDILKKLYIIKDGKLIDKLTNKEISNADLADLFDISPVTAWRWSRDNLVLINIKKRHSRELYQLLN